MKSEERSCALRALTLCDGQTAVRPTPRADRGPCYCIAIDEAAGAGWEEPASAARAERARVVARSDSLGRLLEFRERWRPLEL